MKKLKLNHRYLLMEEGGQIQEWKVIEESKFAYKIQDNTDYDDDKGISVDWILKEGLETQEDLLFIEDLGPELPYVFGIPNLYTTNTTGNPPPPHPSTTSSDDDCCGGDCGCKG